MTIRTLDAEDLVEFDRLRYLLEAIDEDQSIVLVGALMDIERVRNHLRSKYYDRPQELSGRERK